MRILTCCVSSLFLCAAPSSFCEAQKTNPQLSPTETVDLFLKAQNAERWSAAAELLDGEAIEMVRRREVGSSEGAHPFPWTVEKLMKEDPSMPREVAEYQIRRMGKFAKDFEIEKTWSHEFADVETLEDLRKLELHELAVSWVKAHTLGYRTRQNDAACRQLGNDSVRRPTRPSPSKRTYAILGEVMADSMAYVLKQDGFDGKASNPLASMGIIIPPDIFILKSVRGTWKILPSVKTIAATVSIECVANPAGAGEKK